MEVYTSSRQIERLLDIPEEMVTEALRVEEVYPFRCTHYYASLSSGVGDPVFKQFFPSLCELEPAGEEDPFGEEGSTSHPHLVRRYKNRLLVLATNCCFVHCRFCMRKRRWKEDPFFFEDLGVLRDYLLAHPEVEDVIISGGDPFFLPDALFSELLRVVRSVPTVKVVRVGTRAPAVAPEVVVEKSRLLEPYAPVWVNTHFNHPAEVTGEAAEAVMSLIKRGCPVNNQSVLLRGVNDDYRVLKELFMGLLSMGVKPYYLFSCDPVRGVSHFFVPVERGLGIVRRLREEASGMAVPHFAVDGKDGKRIIP